MSKHRSEAPLVMAGIKPGLKSIRRMRDEAKRALSEDDYKTYTAFCREALIEIIQTPDPAVLFDMASMYDQLIEGGRLTGICLFCCCVIDLHEEALR